MKATLEKLENDRVKLEIEVEPERVDTALDRAYRKVVKQVNVPGFRKGKVPRAVLERMYGIGVLLDEALEELVPEAYSEAVNETKIEPIDQPHIDVIEFEPGKPFRFKAEVQVLPEVELGEYKGVAVTRQLERITDENVDEVLAQYREAQAQLVTVDRDTVEEGDYALIDFEGYLDGQPFPGGAAKDYTLHIGSGQFVPGFEEQLIGAKVGEETELTVTFPDNYHSLDLAGKETTFKVTVRSIKVKELPELDDEFAKDVSDKETLAELRADIRERLAKEAERRADERMRNKIVEIVTERAEVNVPDILVDRESEAMVDEFLHSLYHQGVDPDTYLERNNLTKDDLKKDVAPEALRRTKTSLVIDAIGEAEGITVSDEEIDARIADMAGEGPESERYRALLNTPAVRQRLSSQLKVTKTIDLLVEHAVVTEEEIDFGAQEAQESEDEGSDEKVES